MTMESAGASGRRALRLIDVILVVGILVLVAALFLPRIGEITVEQANRSSCASNLKQLGMAMWTWSKSHDHVWPDVYTDPSVRWDDIGNTRADQWNPVLNDGTPTESTPADNGKPVNSNTANFWKLNAAAGLVPEIFICPSSSHQADKVIVDYKKVRDFRGDGFVSYSYQNVLGTYTLTTTSAAMSTQLAVAADASPLRRDIWSGNPGGGVPIGATNKKLAEKPTFVASDETEPWREKAGPIRLPWELNSPNHEFKGQNVLYLDGHVEWKDHPYCGTRFDNIWLRRRAEVEKPIDPADIESIRAFNDTASYDGRSTLPSGSNDDSFLVP